MHRLPRGPTGVHLAQPGRQELGHLIAACLPRRPALERDRLVHRRLLRRTAAPAGTVPLRSGCLGRGLLPAGSGPEQRQSGAAPEAVPGTGQRELSHLAHRAPPAGSGAPAGDELEHRPAVLSPGAAVPCPGAKRARRAALSRPERRTLTGRLRGSRPADPGLAGSRG